MPGRASQSGLYAGFDAENEALFIADTIERMLAEILTIASRCSIAPTFNRGKSKKRCGDMGGNISSWADSASISALKSKTCSRI